MMRRTALLLALLLVVAACGGGSAADFCGEVTRFQEADFSDDPEGALAVLERLERSAPGEIADDMEVMVEGVRLILTALEEGDLSEPEGFDEAEFEAASDRVVAYMEEECGIELEDTDDLEDDGFEDSGASDDSDDIPDEQVYQMVFDGDLSFEHQGETLCTVFEGQMRIDFYELEEFVYDYSATVTGFEGPGTYAGAFEVTDRDASAQGSAQVEVTTVDPVESGLVLVSGSIDGAYGGALGDGTVRGSWSCLLSEDEATGGSGASAGEAAEADSVVEYRISGAATVERAEVGMTICQVDDEMFLLAAPSVNAWGIDVEAAAPQEGAALDAQLRVTPPADSDLVGDDLIFDHVFTGAGTVTFQRVGEAGGFPLLEGTFSGTGLASDAGNSIDVEGTFRCQSF